MARRNMKPSKTVRKQKKSESKSSLKNSKVPKTPVPVTILSGFLGAGKSTLLKYVLESNQHGKRIACIVNDMGAINIDAKNIKRISDEVIDLANGCICCTLRTNLIEELVRLSSKGDYDYIIIESSGISEPAQVAETFDPHLLEHIEQFADDDKLDKELVHCLELIKRNGGLEKWVRLDTCVTVVDSYTIFNDFNTDKMMSDRREDAKDEDRTVVELLIDQLEFANVILVNKIDMVDAATKESVRTLIKKLNHKAKIIECHHGRINVNEILDTKIFNLETARQSAGWLNDIYEMMLSEINGRVTVAPKPESEEYNVRNFVYTRRRPFHPTRLLHLIRDKFICRFEDADANDLPFEEWEDDDEDGSDNDGDDEENDDSNSDEERVKGSPNVEQGSTPATSPGIDNEDMKLADDDDEEEEEDDRREKAELLVPTNEEILANKTASPLFARLFRSKGQIFLATRPDYSGDWSQAGPMLDISGNTVWACIEHRDHKFDLDDELQRYTYSDIQAGGEWGDRSQQLVFIGENLDIQGIEKAFDDCLLTDAEMQDWERIMRDESIKNGDKHIPLEKLFHDDIPDWSIEFIDPWHILEDNGAQEGEE